MSTLSPSYADYAVVERPIEAEEETKKDIRFAHRRSSIQNKSAAAADIQNTAIA
jgi:hypothetical protein